MSNLLEKASILLTPTGYDDGSMNCIKPNTSVGDFDFTRGSSATRVNEQGLIEDVTDTNLPRIDYTDGTGSLLLEPQSTNLITYSEDFSQPAWNKSNTSIQINTTTSPSGNFDGSTLTDNATSSIHRLRDTVSLSASTNYSLSVFAKKNTLSNIQLALINTANSNTISKVFDLENGVIGEELSQGGTTVSDAKIQNYGNGWFRCIIVGQLSSAPNQYQITLATQSTGNSQSVKQVTYSGDGTGSVFLYGAQLEELSYATSYIPTSGSTVTRLKDVCLNSGSSDLISSTEGVLYLEVAAFASINNFQSISLSDGTAQNRIRFTLRSDLNRAFFQVTDGNTGQAFINIDITDITDFNKFAFEYKENDFAAWLNGVKIATDTIGTVPTINQLNFTSGATSQNFNGKVKSVAVYKEALTDAQLTALTT